MIKNKCSFFVLVGVNNRIYPLGVPTMIRPHYPGFDRNWIFGAKSWVWLGFSNIADYCFSALCGVRLTLQIYTPQYLAASSVFGRG